MRSSLFQHSASLARVAGASAIVGGMAGFSAAATPASECHGTGSGHGEGSKLPRQYAHSHATRKYATDRRLRAASSHPTRTPPPQRPNAPTPQRPNAPSRSRRRNHPPPLQHATTYPDT